MNSRTSTKKSSSTSLALPVFATRPAGIGSISSRRWRTCSNGTSTFDREEHELLPLANEILTPDDLQGVQHAFVKAKIKALRKQHRRWGLSSGVFLAALAGAVA